MKLTKDMFDFEKYEYRIGYPSIKDEALFSEGSQWGRPDNNAHQGLIRTPKPKPRYILLNEGESLKRGDECLEYSSSRFEWGPPGDHIIIGEVEAGEIWRRKVQE